MFLRIAKFIEKYFVGVLILGLIFGLLLPQVGKVFEPMMMYLLIVVMFLSFLKINLDDVVHEFVHPAKRIYVVIVTMIIVPTLLYALTSWLGFGQDISIAVLLISAMPAAMAVPALSDIFKGHGSFSMILLLIGSLITPFVVPRLMQSVGDVAVTFSFTQMMILLAVMILVPWIVAQEVKNFFPTFVTKIKPYSTALEIIILFFLVWGPVAKASPYLKVHADKLLLALVWLFVMSIILHIVGWYLLPNGTRKDRISITLSTSYVNLPLAIVFANNFFGPVVAVMVILYDIPWNIMLLPFKLFLEKTNKETDLHLQPAYAHIAQELKDYQLTKAYIPPKTPKKESDPTPKKIVKKSPSKKNQK